MKNLIECKNQCPWHSAKDEKPKESVRSSIILVSSKGTFLILGKYIEDENKVVNGNSMFFVYDSYKWAYLEDLLPCTVDK